MADKNDNAGDHIHWQTFATSEKDEILLEIKAVLDDEERKPPASISFSKSLQLSPERNAIITQKQQQTPNSTDRTNTSVETESSCIFGGEEHTSEGDQDHKVPGSGGSHDGSKKFFIGPLFEKEEAEDDTMQSRVSLLDNEERSCGEMMEIEIVEKLYDNLKKADRALTKEQARRSARERSLIKLAKELRNRKETIEEYTERIAELEEELRLARAERALYEQRLDYHMAHDKSKVDEIRDALQEELTQAKNMMKTTCKDYEARIEELNKSHAKQCEQLCREVINANREVTRLQNKLSELTKARGGMPPFQNGVMFERGANHNVSSWNPRSFFMSPTTTASGNTNTKKRLKRASRSRNALLALSFFVCAIVLARELGFLARDNKMHLPNIWTGSDGIIRSLFYSASIRNDFGSGDPAPSRGAEGNQEPGLHARIEVPEEKQPAETEHITPLKSSVKKDNRERKILSRFSVGDILRKIRNRLKRILDGIAGLLRQLPIEQSLIQYWL